MRNVILKLVLILFIVSCNKQETQLPKTVITELPIFPLKMGNVWKCTYASYNTDGSVQNSGSFVDTIRQAMTIDGKVFLGLGGYFYRQVDNYLVEVAGDRSGIGLERSYIHYHYSNTIDTLWKTETYMDVYIGDTLYCIAYPDDTIINGMKCRRTEMTGFAYYDTVPTLVYKKVMYFAPGKGPVYEARYGSDGMELYKISEISYTPVLISF